MTLFIKLAEFCLALPDGAEYTGNQLLIRVVLWLG